MPKYHMGIALFILAFSLQSAYASDNQPIPLADRVEYASIIGEIKILSTEVVHSDSNSNVICGYKYHAKIIQSFKGLSSGEIFIYAKTNDDVKPDYSNYFFISPAYPKNEKYYVDENGICSAVEVQYFSGGYTQTLFPLDHQHNLMVSRTSPFVSTSYPEVGGYILGFEIVNDHIYALMSWDKITNTIKKLIKASSDKN